MDENKRETKNCPFCGERIFLEAIKCRYCGEFLSDKNSEEKLFIGNAAGTTASKPTKERHNTKMFEEMKLGFAWGNVWITLSFFYGAIFILSTIINIIQGTYIMAAAALAISLLAIGSAIGLLKRKNIGLQLTYIGLALGLVGGVFGVVQKSFQYQDPEIKIFLILLGGSALVTIELLWFKYFQTRRSWFK